MKKEDMVHICNRILLGHKRNKIISSAATWMELEIIILSEVRKNRIPCDITYMWNLKKAANGLIYKTEVELQM